ncbi:MAG: S41 family peptidase, partial [Balneolaceae bacterium]
LLVVKTIDNHPLGLEAGDLVVGYEGKPWVELTYELFEADLPAGGFLASAPESIFNFLMTNAGNNWHLFNTIDVIKFGENEISSLSLEPMFDTVPDEPVFTGEIWNNPQLPVAGVPLPNMDVFANMNAITRGVIDFEGLEYGIDTEKKIGYIYVTDHGYNEVETEFEEAVQFILDSDTDGLIIDLRWNGGGYINPREGQSLLFNAPANEPLNIMRSRVRCNTTDLIEICNSRNGNLNVPNWFNWLPDPNTYYDKKIALLVGPETQSMGENLAYQLASHPMAEVFGRPTNGGFSGNTFSGVDIGERWEANMPNFHIVDPAFPDVPLARTSLKPDVEVWMDPADAANNIDTIVKEAIHAIINVNSVDQTIYHPDNFQLSQNYPNPFNPSTNISFELPQAGLVQLRVYNLLGQEVASLVDQRMNSGNHSVNFDASQLSSGVYIYRLVAGDQAITKKMMLIK